MKDKLIAIVTAGCVMATLTCAQAQKIYWVHADNSPLNLADPQTRAQLDQAITACTIPGDEPSQQHARDFEGCMLSKGWKEKDIRPVEENASGTSVHLSPEGQKEFDKTVSHARREEMIPNEPQVSFGIQGYHDKYHEPSPDVNSSTNYFGITAAYSARLSKNDFWMIDGRIDHGTVSYNSPSGTVSGIPEYEGELRLTVGRDYPLDDSWLSPYIGLGTRIFRQLGDGYRTDLGAYMYDRRIEQLYLPLGATWRTLLGRVQMADTLEVDPLLIGRVNSRLQNGGGVNLVDTQSPFTGYGVRGSIMFGVPMQNHLVEVGPFFPYWDMHNSEPEIISCVGLVCQTGIEPENRRLQLGMDARVSF